MRASTTVSAVLILSAFVVGCAQQAAPATNDAAKTVAVETHAIVPATMDEAALRKAIAAALREQRIYSPGGDNAIELYVALRALHPDDTSVQMALLELEPYAVIAAEQSTQRGEFPEAQRLLALIASADAQASALPRLRDQLAQREKLVNDRIAADAASTAIAAAAQLSSQAAPITAPVGPLPTNAVKPVAAPTTLASDDRAVAAGPAAVLPAGNYQAPASAQTSLPIVAPAPSRTSIAARAAPTHTPMLLRDQAPRYPANALRRRIEGSVDLAFTIKPDGTVTDVRVLHATPEGVFDVAALAVAKQWKFEASAQEIPGRRLIAFDLPKDAP